MYTCIHIFVCVYIYIPLEHIVSRLKGKLVLLIKLWMEEEEEEEGAELTLTRINALGNSNSLHLTSLCEKKSRETFDKHIFHVMKTSLWGAVKPGNIACWPHNNQSDGGCQAGVKWGIPLGNRLIVHLHGDRREGNTPPHSPSLRHLSWAVFFFFLLFFVF